MSTAVPVAALAPPYAVVRSLRAPRARTWIAWAIMGGIGTWADKIHQLGQVSAYPNAEWIGERVPVSPVYVAAGVGFFALYAVVVGLRKGTPALWGGASRTVLEVLKTCAGLLAAYTVTAVAAGLRHRYDIGPFFAAAVLALWAAPSYWKLRKTRVPLYGALVMILGTSFEWIATSHGAFVYPVCPATPCLGATVPLVWLPLLYAHVGLFFHRLAGGPNSTLV